jgi:hypothetical protein
MAIVVFERSNYSGYSVLDRGALLSELERRGVSPAFDRIVAEHVTYRYPDPDPAPDRASVLVVAYVRGDGVDALVVEVDGTTVRPDERIFHITLSLDEDVAPKAANDAVATRSWQHLDEPVGVPVEPF